jgi:hypothetical protein
MATKVVALEDFAKELGAFTDTQIENLKQATLLGIAAAIPHLVETSPVDTGLYAQSWDFKAEEWGAIVGNTAPHSPIIEYGARPFTPPIGPLLAWAKRVLKDPSQPPDYSNEVWALARGTQNKIAAVGMQPKHVMENAIPKIIENIKSEYERLNG